MQTKKLKVEQMEEVVAELERERQKNAELSRRIAALEAQMQCQRGKRTHCMNDNGQEGGYVDSPEERGSKREKIQELESFDKIRGSSKGVDICDRLLFASESQQVTGVENGHVRWMNTDRSLFLPEECNKNGDTVMEFEETDDSDDEDKPCTDVVSEDYVSIKDLFALNEQNTGAEDDTMQIKSLQTKVSQDESRIKKNAINKNLSLQKKAPKVAFCPKEVKAILDSETLAMKNAQSHTIRKIIVFASLGIRHGCDDMCKLDYHHFSILNKGEPYVSPSNPGEHVLYSNPGVKTRVFYRNHHNPALCPVRILEEEQAMRPSDATCPSCLFLCIKYGGRTRNIPQNEYVLQRMGRNKLKSFGPLICQMAMLVNVRTGSFFFKALSITLLFMAGFPDDIVWSETKYRSLDLLQKYYRRDEDAAGEELFLAESSPTNLVGSAFEKPSSRTTKSKGKKQADSTCKATSPKHPLATQTSLAPPTAFGLLGYTSNQNPQEAAVAQTTLYHSLLNSPHTQIIHPRLNTSHNFHPLYPMFPTHPANAMMPFMYWPPAQSMYPTYPYTSLYGDRSLGAVNPGHYISFQPQPYYNQGLETCSNVVHPKPPEDPVKDGCRSTEVVVSDSESSSGSTKRK